MISFEFIETSPTKFVVVATKSLEFNETSPSTISLEFIETSLTILEMP